MNRKSQPQLLQQLVKLWPWLMPSAPVAASVATTTRRPSCLFDAGQSLPQWRQADSSAHRRYHHHYEDLLS